MKKLSVITLIIIFCVVFFPSCKKNNGEAPMLPPLESMAIDFSNFASLKKSGDLIYDQKGTENSNWDFAATVAGVWKSLISVTLVVPVTSFARAIDQDPVFISENTWQWSYNVSFTGETYKARLTGEMGTSNVLWKMYITKEGAGSFAEFLWFEGTSKLDGTGGQWILNESSQTPTVLLQIDWTKTGASIGSVTYTYMKNDSFKTSSIEYGLTQNDLNAYYSIYYYDSTALVFSNVDVEWNTSTHNGRVKSSDYLLGDWYCWNEQKINIVCPI